MKKKYEEDNNLKSDHNFQPLNAFIRFPFFSWRESERYPLPIAVIPPRLFYETPTEGTSFFPHADIRTGMIWGQPALITKCSPAGLAGERECDNFSR
jgi:hypothetical protein